MVGLISGGMRPPTWKNWSDCAVRGEQPALQSLQNKGGLNCSEMYGHVTTTHRQGLCGEGGGRPLPGTVVHTEEDLTWSVNTSELLK